MGGLNRGEWQSSMGRGVCGGRWEEVRVVRVSLTVARRCQMQVEHLGIEQRKVAFSAARIRGIPDTSEKFI